MANGQITSINEYNAPSSSQDIFAISEGRVGQVCKEWLVREDENLAYRLQNEEISQHYKKNRSQNKIVRQDIPLAKHLQKNELDEARKKYERYIQEQLANDERVAHQVELNLIAEEEKTKKATEEADERLAKKLMEKEKARQLKKKLEKEQKQVEILSAQIGADYQIKFQEKNNSVMPVASTSREIFSQPTYQRILTEDEREIDLSEFCMPPPPGLTHEEMKLFLEDQDAEIARLLQRQELKRSKNPEKEKLALIEAQDFEIAKMLQKLEKERAKRIKDKLKNKKHNQNDLRAQNSSDILNNIQRTSTPLTPQKSWDTNEHNHDYDIPEGHLLETNTYEEPYQTIDNIDKESSLVKNFHNIAIDLDPTYQRRIYSQSQLLIESSVDDYEVENNEFEANENQFRLRSIAQSNDSLEKAMQRQKKSSFLQPTVTSSTSSSRSSNTSRSSFQQSMTDSVKHQKFNKANSLLPDNEDLSPPPLPPRDVSLLPRQNKIDETVSSNEFSVSISTMPPHHPQHPNRRFQNHPNSLTVAYNNNISNPLIPGQKRLVSLEKLSKKNQKNFKNQDKCKTQ